MAIIEVSDQFFDVYLQKLGKKKNSSRVREAANFTMEVFNRLKQLGPSTRNTICKSFRLEQITQETSYNSKEKGLVIYSSKTYKKRSTIFDALKRLQKLGMIKCYSGYKKLGRSNTIWKVIRDVPQ